MDAETSKNCILRHLGVRQVCIRLQREYEKRFEETKALVARCPLEGTFECSSMYIFGKFKKFCGRLQKVRNTSSHRLALR